MEKFKTSNKSKKLTKLATRYKNGDKTVKNEFSKELDKYLRIVCLGKVQKQDYNYLIAESHLQILKALPRYDETKGQFTTFIQFRIIDAIEKTDRFNDQPGYYLPRLVKTILKNDEFIKYKYSSETKDYNTIKEKLKQIFPKFTETQLCHVLPYLYDNLYNYNHILTSEEVKMTQELIPDQKSKEDVIFEAETKKLAHRCLSLMDPEIRIAVMKIYGIEFEQQTVTSIAKEMGISRQTLTHRINETFAKVRDLLEFEELTQRYLKKTKKGR